MFYSFVALTSFGGGVVPFSPLARSLTISLAIIEHLISAYSRS
jgi:hypothetical protein